MRNIKAVFTKQILSFFKNSSMFGTPIAFLGIPFAILILIPGVNMAANIVQFVVMFVGISMVGIAAAFIAEDRVTMNLRFMGMAGVKPYQYLIGTCATLLLISFGALVLFALMGRYYGAAMTNFLIIAMLGAVNSMLLGITLSLSKLAPFTSIIGILLGVGPAFSEANETLANIFYFIYTKQVAAALRGDLSANFADTIQIILINTGILLLAFIVMNTRNGLDGERLNKPVIKSV